jgi:hypothetical protein
LSNQISSIDPPRLRKPLNDQLAICCYKKMIVYTNKLCYHSHVPTKVKEIYTSIEKLCQSLYFAYVKLH